MRIGQLAARADVSTRTVRYYESVGLVAAPARTHNGYRDYDEDAATRLRFVRAAQAAGFSLHDIKGILSVRDNGEPPCRHVKQLIGQYLGDVDDRIGALQAARTQLLNLQATADSLDVGGCAGTDICRIIDPGSRGMNALQP